MIEVGEVEKTRIAIDIKEYHKLKEAANWLSALERAGVNHWEGIDYALDIFEQEGDY